MNAEINEEQLSIIVEFVNVIKPRDINSSSA